MDVCSKKITKEQPLLSRLVLYINFAALFISCNEILLQKCVWPLLSFFRMNIKYENMKWECASFLMNDPSENFNFILLQRLWQLAFIAYEQERISISCHMHAVIISSVWGWICILQFYECANVFMCLRLLALYIFFCTLESGKNCSGKNDSKHKHHLFCKEWKLSTIKLSFVSRFYKTPSHLLYNFHSCDILWFIFYPAWIFFFVQVERAPGRDDVHCSREHIKKCQ